MALNVLRARLAAIPNSATLAATAGTQISRPPLCPQTLRQA